MIDQCENLEKEIKDIKCKLNLASLNSKEAKALAEESLYNSNELNYKNKELQQNIIKNSSDIETINKSVEIIDQNLQNEISDRILNDQKFIEHLNIIDIKNNEQDNNLLAEIRNRVQSEINLELKLNKNISDTKSNETNIQNINIKQYFNLDMIVQYAIGAVNAVTSIFDIFVAVIVSVYILSERDEILGFLKKFACAIFKDRTYKNIDKYFNNSNEIFFKFIASQFLDAIVVGILVTIAMTIMGIKYAPLLGFFIGLFNMIPYVGAIIAVAISAVITLITGGLTQAIWMLIVVIILQQIDANIINPKIVGQSLKVSPLLVIFAITVGGAYFGMLGMFLAVPVSAVVRILVEDYVDFKLAEKIKKKETEIESSKSY